MTVPIVQPVAFQWLRNPNVKLAELNNRAMLG